MKFTSLLKSLIVEQSRFEVLLNNLTKPGEDKEGNKTKPKLSKKEFFELVKADPTTRLNNVNLETAKPEELAKVKAGSYVAWLIKSYLMPTVESQPGDYFYERDVKLSKETFMEDLYKVNEDLIKFERFKTKLPQEMRDINKLTPFQLYNAVKDFDLTIAKTTKSERKSAPVHPGGELVFDGPNSRVVKITDKGQLGKEAACYYGGGDRDPKETRWCTASPGLSWFDNYIKDGPLYVVYNPNDPKVTSGSGLPVERYQFHFQRGHYMDKDDQQIDLIGFLNGRMKELKDYFKPEFVRGMTIGGGQKLTIDSLSSGSTGKFIALYGLDELIESIPADLTELSIANREKSDIIINIPPAISRLKNLEALFLENCIDSLPNEICELKNLAFLTLVNNPKLRSVPECIGNMPNLIFVNFRGSNVEAPAGIKERGSDMGDNMWDMMS